MYEAARLLIDCCPGSQNSVAHICGALGGKSSVIEAGSCKIIVNVEALTKEELEQNVNDIRHLPDVKKVTVEPELTCPGLDT